MADPLAEMNTDRTRSDCNFFVNWRIRTESDWEIFFCFDVIILNASQILVVIRFYRLANCRSQILVVIRFYRLANCRACFAIVATTPLAFRWNARFTTNGMWAKNNTIYILRKSLVVKPNFAIFSYIRSSYVSSTIDIARTVFTNLSLLDPPIKDF